MLIKNSFSFNELVNFVFCKLLAFPDYPYTLEYEKVLLTTVNTSYADYQRFLLHKYFSFLGFYSQCQKKLFLLFREKKCATLGENSQLQGGFSTLGENSQLQGKILNSRGKFSTQVENSELWRKFSIQEKILNPRENSQLKEKFST